MNPYEGMDWQELESALTENYAEQSDTHARIVVALWRLRKKSWRKLI